MKFYLFIFVLKFVLIFNANADMNYEPIGKTYIIKDRIFTVSNNGFLDEIYLCKPTAKKCEKIDKVWSFVALAKNCKGIDEENIYFARNKEHFFMGGINENAPLRIYNFDGEVLGSAPNLDYAKPHCNFYEEQKEIKKISIKKISPENIVENIDICAIGSSLGQTCKDKTFDPQKYFRNGKKKIKNKTVHYAFNDWDYYFKIIEQNDKEILIEFEDNAKHSSYLSVALIKLKYINETKKWKTVSTKTIYPKSEAQSDFVLVGNNSLDDRFIINFDGLCVQNIDRIETINKFALSEKWMDIPEGQDALIAPRVKGPSYKAYGFKEGENVFLVGINDAENTISCSIASPYNNIKTIKKKLNEFYKLKLLTKQNQGIQNLEIYNANLIQSEKAMIVMNFSEQENMKVISLTVMMPDD